MTDSIREFVFFGFQTGARRDKSLKILGAEMTESIREFAFFSVQFESPNRGPNRIKVCYRRFLELFEAFCESTLVRASSRDPLKLHHFGRAQVRPLPQC